MIELNWFNETNISFLAREASLFCLRHYKKNGKSFIHEHQIEILFNEYYNIFSHDFAQFSKYAKQLGFLPIREE